MTARKNYWVSVDNIYEIQLCFSNTWLHPLLLIAGACSLYQLLLLYVTIKYSNTNCFFLHALKEHIAVGAVVWVVLMIKFHDWENRVIDFNSRPSEHLNKRSCWGLRNQKLPKPGDESLGDKLGLLMSEV